MVKEHDQMKRFTTGARNLMEGGYVDPGAGRYSMTLFMSVTRRDSDVEEAALLAAAKQGWSMVTLEFGRTGQSKGPLSYSVSFLGDEGATEIARDCMLVHDGDETFVLAPRSATYHFAVGPNGLERRHGRPANVAAGAIRATRALVDAARRADPKSPFVEVHRLDDVV